MSDMDLNAPGTSRQFTKIMHIGVSTCFWDFSLIPKRDVPLIPERCVPNFLWVVVGVWRRHGRQARNNNEGQHSNTAHTHSRGRREDAPTQGHTEDLGIRAHWS